MPNKIKDIFSDDMFNINGTLRFSDDEAYKNFLSALEIAYAGTCRSGRRRYFSRYNSRTSGRKISIGRTHQHNPILCWSCSRDCTYYT